MPSDVTVMNVIEGRSNLQELYTRVRNKKPTQRLTESVQGQSGVIYHFR